MSKICKNALKATTLIYIKDGNEAGSLSGQGTYVELDAISRGLTERGDCDRRRNSFYKMAELTTVLLSGHFDCGAFGWWLDYHAASWPKMPIFYYTSRDPDH